MSNSNRNKRKSVSLLPSYFQTNKNSKFLSGTIDSLYSVPSLTRFNGFVGSKLGRTYNAASDVYINNPNNELRNKYQFDPALVNQDSSGNIKNAFAIDDLINQLSFYGATTDNFNKLFSPDINAYYPHIDWDKFVNFREYYWLPLGPFAITISGQQRNTVSTYTVTDSLDGNYFIFTPDGLTEDPVLTFYRGVTYVLNINSKHSFYIKTNNGPGQEGSLTGAGVSKGQIIFTVTDIMPGTLYYSSDDIDVVPGNILVRNITENSYLDIDADIIGKSSYTTASGIELINGLKVNFEGNITPSSYLGKDFIVEGVGESIRLVDFSILQTPENVSTQYDVNFDATPFDDYPFDNFQNLPLTPEYVTINRSSRDLNPWSRYNRWFHSDVIRISANANGIIPTFPVNQRAVYPIVEFRPDLQLYNFGTNSIPSVDLIDQVNEDVFSTIEGAISSTVDGLPLQPGQTIIFNADLDPLIRGKVFEVTLSRINGVYKINLVKKIDPVFGNSVVILSGDTGKAVEWWFNGSEWVVSQQRTVLNQAPLFDLFDNSGNSYSDKSYYDSIFSGNKIFGYAIGTGSNDPILGFPLLYKNIGVEGLFLFQNYFNSDIIKLLAPNSVTDIPTSDTFLRINNGNLGFEFVNIWNKTERYQIPVQQFQTISSGNSIPITSFDNPALISDLKLDVFINNNKLSTSDFELVTDNTDLIVTLKNTVNSDTNVLINLYTSENPNSNGIYETPINLTNNPLNGKILQFTFSEISDHVKSMIDRDPRFIGKYPGISNLKSLPDISKYGSRIITNNNPLAFSQEFITNIEHSLIPAIRDVGNDYYQYKLNLIKFATHADINLTPAEALDELISEINSNKNSSFPYSQSDMIAYGNDFTVKTYTVTDSRNVVYPLSTGFSLTDLSFRSVLLYLNGVLLSYEKDYTFNEVYSTVQLTVNLNVGDTLLIKDYKSTIGNYVPPTPTKLGLYPKYVPSIFIDYSYVTPQVVIQGHDGSLTIAYTTIDNFNQQNYDFRDLILLEFELRIFNNIKVNYNRELINLDSVLPGLYRKNDYTYTETYKVIESDFIKWASVFNINYTENLTYNVDEYKTYNYKSSIDYITGNNLPTASWRGIYKYYYDTDRPDTCPWEMLGFSIMPSWWESEYGPAPYTSGNLNLWQDLEAGLIKQGSRSGIDLNYARPGLTNAIPVDEHGNLVDIRYWNGITTEGFFNNTDQAWVFGDCGPAETAWRRSSLWPFAAQVIMALSKPADYAAKMYDPFRLTKDATGQYRYGDISDFLRLNSIPVFSDNNTITTGYSVFVVEYGKKRSSGYVTTLKNDLLYSDFNLFYKAGGFLSKDKLEILIDSVSPNTASPGVILANEDYDLFYNVSNSVKSVSISGIIVEKVNAQFVIKGYDKESPYFNVHMPIHRNNDTLVTVGGKSAPFLKWTENTLYQAGQIVEYNNHYYTVNVTLNSGSEFSVVNYIKLSQLPIVGGSIAYDAELFEENITPILYGSRFNTIQEVYDIIVGYGNYLSKQGFQFNQYNSDLGAILDWKFSAKEFLYWTTQGWANGSVITISPFSNQIDFQFTDSVIDNVLNSFYEYSLLTANGQSFPRDKFKISREDNIFSIVKQNTNQGLYFARLNLIQKEHAIILNNNSMFGDIIYDIETGYRQSRIKLSGFITSEWNGNYLVPGFVYDEAIIFNWQPYKDYSAADVVKYSGKYYSAKVNLAGSATFNAASWNLLGKKPVAALLPNFDYKINQFEDFYSLDIDNFDISQQKMAQHLLGYTPRNYLTNIIVDPIAQYKFYQGFIKEKGTANAINKLAKASMHNLQGQISFNEEWAFRVGSYGNYTTYNEIEFPLKESDFKENSQIVTFVDSIVSLDNTPVSYIVPSDLSIIPSNYLSNNVFSVVPSCTYLNNNLLLPTAGYVRIDDVTATAYNKNSLLDVANNNNLNDGDTIWVGFKSNNDWDVYRYTKQSAKVISSTILNPASTLLFTTDGYHNLSVGDIISVNGLDNGTNGIYEILSIPTLTSFSVSTTLSSVSVSSTTALLFKFNSVRVNNFDDIDSLQSNLLLKFEEKVWADNGDGVDAYSKWTVYQKNNNFNPSVEFVNGTQSADQQFGYRLASSNNGDILVVSAPYYHDVSNGYGKVFVYNNLYNQSPTLISTFGVNNPTYQSSPTSFGSSLLYDSKFNVVIVGAPDANLIQVSSINGDFITEFSTILNIRLGDELYLTKTIDSLGNKILYAAAPADSSIYAFNFNVITTETGITGVLEPLSNISLSTETDKYLITGNSDGTVIAISTPNIQGITSYVSIYNGNTLTQSIYPPMDFNNNDYWGSAIAVTDDGQYLFISSTSSVDTIHGPGKVFVFNKTGSGYQLIQTILNPLKNQSLNFGTHIAIKDNNTIYISANGTQTLSSTIDSNQTFFDNDTTSFYDNVTNSGSVYIFEKRNSKFIFARELFDNGTLLNGSGYGSSVTISNGNVFVGAPLALPNYGDFYQFAEIVKNSPTWNILRQEDDLVDLSKVRRAVTIDSQSSKVLDYLDIVDPVKGKILGLADQELRYKTAFDPAIYSIGVQGVNVDTNTSWIEDHIGELWWDLSTVKYVWYEQSDLEYRKNSWGKLFPGCSIDVYEWVMSEYLPSQWSALADTTDGLSKNISGQPKYTDNSVVSVKQYYDSTTGLATNVYFYWVKNKVIVPNVPDRRLSANEVSNLIYNPASNGTKFLSLISQNAIAVTNVINDLNSNNIYLNVSSDTINNSTNQHTEWLLLSEGDETKMPTTMLNRKLIDSLVGYDSLGNVIPDPLLNDRQKYGVEFRPKQSMFVNRTEALRNVIEYVNSVFAQYRISDIANFSTLNSKEEIPDEYSRTYDLIVDSYDDLVNLVTIDKATASLTCVIDNGSISSVQIINTGSSYGALLPVSLDVLGNPIAWAGPRVEIVPVTGDILGNASISTVINENGNIVSASIDNSGTGFSTAPTLIVRPYTVIVRSDSNSNNLWAEYKRINNKWVKTHTQDYDTTQYWSYVDWISNDYDKLKSLTATVDELWQLNEINVSKGSYVKVTNQGNGKYIILEKTNSNGNFTDDYNLVRSENATIQLSDNLWNLTNSYYNYDYHFTYDQTLYDQTPITELINILNAIKNDIFVGSLKVYWNYTFFKAVKYAFAEQKFLDWAFKTAFLNVKNLAGSLDQRPVYRFQNSQYYEDYLMEVKPYHSKIRNYQLNYNTLDNSQSYINDFDLPSYYDRAQESFINVLNEGTVLNQYPWKSWKDNYSLSVESAVVAFPGSGYTAVPQVQIITADGDSGSGATAEAHISLGKVTSVVITNPGSGYTKTPTIILVGGGSTSLIPATVYPRMSNNKVRRNTLEMKFDRITPFSEVSNEVVYDQFIANGNTYEFTLSWPAEHKKSNISLTISDNNIGTRVLATQYNIVTTKKIINNYHRYVSTLVLNFVPTRGQLVSISYNKNINLFSAVDRIDYYYQPTVGMPGKDPSQLMSGIDLSIPQIQGLMFDYTTNWDMTPFGKSLYGDDSSYYTTATVSSTSIAGTNTLVVSNLTGIYPGLRVNTVSLNTSTLNTNKFNDTNVTVINVISTNSSVVFSTTTVETISAGTVLLEFWEFNLTPGILDTVLDGGDLSYTNAIGINPEDIIVDADQFVSPYISNSPEEMLKGEMYESLGISVYTRTHTGSPLVVHSINQITQTGTNTVINLPMMPPNNASVMVVFNNSVINYGNDYSIDYKNNTITINTQTVTGTIGITVVGIGGVDLITSDFTTVTNSSTISVHVGFASEIGSIYATLNGVQLNSNQYTLSSGKLIVNGISTGTNTLQAWSFSSTHHQFSNVTEEYFVSDGVTNSYLLSVYPGNLGPANAQAIVEIDSKRLISPTTVYYSVSGNQTVFLIDPNDTYPLGTFDLNDLEIFVNGIKIRNGIDFYVDQPNNTVVFYPGFLQTGDAMAITNHTFSDYYFNDGYIYIKSTTNYATGSILKVISFTNGDNSLIRTDTFVTRPSNRYNLSRPVLSDQYIWVTVENNPLVNGVDFYLDSTGSILSIRDTYPIVEGQIISVLSMTDSYLNKGSIGYRVFTDILGRSQFKRISRDNTTRLAEPLYSTSTTIVVENADVLTEPDLLRKIPGSILINGEWIEFLTINHNVLSNLRRSTLGTGAKSVYPAGTSVIDQGILQNAPYKEGMMKQILTITNTTSYLINGINLTTSTLNDQFTVLYAGDLLKKEGYYNQDLSVSYDTYPYNIIGSVSTPSTSTFSTSVKLYDAYLVTSTNQVWIYLNSNNLAAINGFMYTGLNYKQPDYTINNLTLYGSTATAILNLNLNNLITGTQLTILQKVATNTMYASTGTSMLVDNGLFGVFLRDAPTTIPDKYYYGQL